MPPLNRVYTLVKTLSAAAWCGVAVTYLFYDYFVDWNGLHPVPCNSAEKVIQWRSNFYCASSKEAWLWITNYRLLYIFLALGVIVPMVTSIVYNFRKNGKK